MKQTILCFACLAALLVLSAPCRASQKPPLSESDCQNLWFVDYQCFDCRPGAWESVGVVQARARYDTAGHCHDMNAGHMACADRYVDKDYPHTAVRVDYTAGGHHIVKVARGGACPSPGG